MYIVLIDMAKVDYSSTLTLTAKEIECFLCTLPFTFSCSVCTEDNMRGKRGWHLRVSRAQGFLSKNLSAKRIHAFRFTTQIIGPNAVVVMIHWNRDLV